VFCRKSLLLLTITTLSVSLFASCNRRRRPNVERVAIAPFENLSSDLKLDWAGRALSSALVYDLAPAGNLYAEAVDSTSGAFTAQATRLLEGYFSQRNGQLTITATFENLGRTKTLASFELSGPTSEGLLPLVNQLAKGLSSSARPFGTKSLEAFRTYGSAVGGAANPEALGHLLEAATAADPHFAIAYLIGARLLMAQGKREAALKELQAARAANPDAIDRAEIDYFGALIAGDVDGRAKALEALTQRTPANAGWFRELGALRLAQRRIQEATQSYEAATRLAGDDAELWNQLGYTYALGLDLTSANRALEHYEQMLGPSNSNALDSLGEVNYFLGDFSEAGRDFFEAQEKNPGRRWDELIKAAESRLMLGDLAGADANFQKYLALAQRSQHTVVESELAQWEFLTGRREAGMARLGRLVPALAGDQQSLGYSQLALWKLQTGSTKEGAELAAKSEALAQSQRTRNLSAICQAIASGSSSAAGPPILRAYTLLFARKFADARQPLEAIYRETAPTADGQIRTLLAWAEVESGRIGDARKLVQLYPLPWSSGDPVFASLIFPRFFYLRGVVLQDESKRSKAKQSYELYLKYAGDVPDIFGDEAAARRRLGI
jgi:tetratricopeptide (TPR) repeat protein